jgi:DNA polymerase-3 subunit delta'
MGWAVFGHDWAVDHLSSALLNRRARHAYLFVGPEGMGKETLARAFAQAMLCQNPDAAARPCGVCTACVRIASSSHPDILFGEPEGAANALKIEEVRRVAGGLALRPFESPYRIAIFRDFDRARPLAQDALLKTLEEPPGHGVIMLLATTLEPVLPTIRSRSQVLHLRPAPFDAVSEALRAAGAETALADRIAAFSGGRIGWALRAWQDPAVLEARSAALDALEALIAQGRAGRFKAAEALAKDKDALIEHLTLWQTYWRDLLHLTTDSREPLANRDREHTLRALAAHTDAAGALAALRATGGLLHTLTTTNANIRLALDVMLLAYPGLAYAR